MRAGHPLNAALTDGFALGFTISALLMGVAVVAALALFRNEGRSQRISLTDLVAVGIEEEAL